MTVFATSGALWVKVPMMFGPMAPALVMITVAQSSIARITPPSQRGVVLGALVEVFALGGVVSPLVLGWIVDSAANPAVGYRDGWLVTAAPLLVTGLLAALFMRPKKDARQLGVPGRQTPHVLITAEPVRQQEHRPIHTAGHGGVPTADLHTRQSSTS